eukprot:TRINITY_DN19772_c0_g1_i1.p1 TRINITY_DN19772_c0_g1~~TRINITY_DN19772_c0_g1_i1.p1  ORF type:complete len:110 (+),score=6.05 TRINITY_DN19772_c0_g1_i1:38-331(+)
MSVKAMLSAAIKTDPAKTALRRRSYAMQLLDESNLSAAYAGCIITHDEATTDDQFLLSSSGDHKESPFCKKSKISIQRHKNRNIRFSHQTSKSFNSV